MDMATRINLWLALASFILAAVSVITVIITLIQNKRILKANALQLEEMREEHRLSSQPIIDCEDLNFYVFRPNIFSTQEGSYTCQSRYLMELRLKNVTDATALCVDLHGKVVIPDATGHFEIISCVDRHNIIAAKAQTVMVNLPLIGDEDASMFQALNSQETMGLPRLIVTLTYKNTSGGCFVSNREFLLMPTNISIHVLNEWYEAIKKAPYEIISEFELLYAADDEEQSDKTLKNMRARFEKEFSDPTKQEVELCCEELNQKYDLRSLTKKEYEAIIQEDAFPKYIHITPEC